MQKLAVEIFELKIPFKICWQSRHWIRQHFGAAQWATGCGNIQLMAVWCFPDYGNKETEKKAVSKCTQTTPTSCSQLIVQVARWATFTKQLKIGVGDHRNKKNKTSEHINCRLGKRCLWINGFDCTHLCTRQERKERRKGRRGGLRWLMYDRYGGARSRWIASEMGGLCPQVSAVPPEPNHRWGKVKTSSAHWRKTLIINIYLVLINVRQPVLKEVTGVGWRLS